MNRNTLVSATTTYDTVGLTRSLDLLRLVQELYTRRYLRAFEAL